MPNNVPGWVWLLVIAILVVILLSLVGHPVSVK